MLKALPDSDRQPVDISAVPGGVLTRAGSVITTGGRALARVLTGAVYISAGYEAARAPGGRVGKASNTLSKIRRVIPLPVDDELIVRAMVLHSSPPARHLLSASNREFQRPSWLHHSCQPALRDTRSGRLRTPWNGVPNSCNFSRTWRCSADCCTQ